MGDVKEDGTKDSTKDDPSKDENMLQIQAVNSYKMRPSLTGMFKGTKIKSIIQTVLNEKLQGKVYGQTEAGKWTKEIADTVNAAIKELDMEHYKHVVQVVLAQQLGEGARFIAKCCWDAESDSQISDIFTNSSLICICVVFGTYLY